MRWRARRNGLNKPGRFQGNSGSRRRSDPIVRSAAWRGTQLRRAAGCAQPYLGPQVLRVSVVDQGLLRHGPPDPIEKWRTTHPARGWELVATVSTAVSSVHLGPGYGPDTGSCALWARTSAISRAFGYRHGRPREPADFFNRFLAMPTALSCRVSPTPRPWTMSWSRAPAGSSPMWRISRSLLSRGLDSAQAVGEPRKHYLDAAPWADTTGSVAADRNPTKTRMRPW